MDRGFDIEATEYGPWLLLKGLWHEEIKKYMTINRIRGLYLNYAKGWNGLDLHFIRDVPDLQLLKIIDPRIRDILPIHLLPDLRYLSISTNCRTPIDFLKFPHLEECFLKWRPKADSIFLCDALRKLYLDQYKGRESAPFSSLQNLESLRIGNSPLMEIHAFSELNNLQHLGLYYMHTLSSLKGLQSLKQLQKLEICVCKRIVSFDDLEGLANLRELVLDNCGDIASVEFLRSLRCLEIISFVESTNVLDGNLEVLLMLPNLRRVHFRNRPHYTHSREELNSFLRSRGQIRT